VIAGFCTALGNPSWATDQEYLLLLNEGKKLQESKAKYRIDVKIGDQVAIPFTSNSPTSVNLWTGLPRLIKP
jgi:hypothetical protein